MRALRGAALAALLFSCGTLWADQSLNKNGSMESGQGKGAIDPQIADKWTEFGTNVERSPTVNFVPAGDGHSLKSFGDATSSSAGAYQEVAVTAGQSVSVSAQLHTPSFDKLGGSGACGIVLEFLNTFGGTISTQSVSPLTASSPGDTWIPANIGPISAPAGTTKIRFTCRLTWSVGNIFGACYWDDAQVHVNGGANLLVNGDFETAGPSPGQSPVGIDNWNGFNDQEKSTAFALDGAASLQLGVRESYNGLFQDLGLLNAGDHLELTAYVYSPSTEPINATTFGGIKLEFDPNGTVPPAVENLPFTAANAADVWTPVSLTTTVPAGITIARVLMVFNSVAGTTGAVYFDSATALRSTTGSANKLSNDSFEMGGGGFDGLTDWTEYSAAGVSEARKSCFVIPGNPGFCSARATGTSFAGLGQEITVTPGETLTVSALLYTPSFEKLTGQFADAGVKVEWAFGGVPTDIDIVLGQPNTVDASMPKNTWVPITIDYTMPAGSSALGRFVCILAKGTATTGKLYYDAVETVVTNRYDGSDVDNDDDEDLLDFAELQRCFSGNGGGLDWNCSVFDNDSDGDLDLLDWDFFRPRMTGPN